LGRIHFDPNELSANGQAKTKRDWSDLESRLRDLARPSSQAAASGLAVEPQVTLAHDPHDSLAAFEAFAGPRRAVAEVSPLPSPAPHASAQDARSRTEAAPPAKAQPVAPQAAPAEPISPDLLALLAAISTGKNPE